MDWNKLHIIKDNRCCVAFYAPAMLLLPLDENKADILLTYQKYMVNNSSTDTINNFVKQIESFIKAKNLSTDEGIVAYNPKNITKIMLCVSNDCNLRCKYCYAAGGSYMQKRGLMTLETAKRFIEFCNNQFESIDRIIFFGGEPFLNIDVIEYICESFDEQNKLKPKFGAVTNGTICNERVLNVVNKYFSYLSISVDGPKNIHDINRVDINGNGSFDRSKKFISAIRNNTKVNLACEATFTQQHIENGYTRSSIANFFSKEIGLQSSIIDDMHINKSEVLNYWKNINYENLKTEKLDNLTSDFWNLFELFINNECNHRCRIGADILTIAHNGDIYPCHQLNGKEKCKLGNIFGDNVFNSNHYEKNFNHLMSVDKNDKCNNCWCKNLCSPCTISRFFNEKLSVIESNPQKGYCTFIKQFIETLLPIIALLRKNTHLWNLVKNKMIAKL